MTEPSKHVIKNITTGIAYKKGFKKTITTGIAYKKGLEPITI